MTAPTTRMAEPPTAAPTIVPVLGLVFVSEEEVGTGQDGGGEGEEPTREGKRAAGLSGGSWEGPSRSLPLPGTL